MLILVELRNKFFSTQMFVHLIELFVLYCEDNFQVIKGVHPQRHMIFI